MAVDVDRSVSPPRAGARMPVPGGAADGRRRYDGRPVNVVESLLSDVLPALHARHALDAGARGEARAATAPAASPRGSSSPSSSSPIRIEARSDGRSTNARAASPIVAVPTVAVPCADERSAGASRWAHDCARLDASLRGTDDTAWNREMTALRLAMAEGGLSRRVLREAVIAPAAARLGTAWTEDTASFVDVTIGTSRLMSALDRLPGRVRDGAGARVVLTPVPGDGHVLGLLLLAEALREGGLAVQVMARASAAAVGRAVGGRADILGIGVSVARHAGRAAMLVRAVRSATRDGAMPLVVAGGCVASECASLLRAAGVDDVVPGAVDPAVWLGERLSERMGERMGERLAARPGAAVGA